MMLIIIVVVYLMAGVRAQANWQNMREFVPSEFFNKFDEKVSQTEALKFDFPRDKNFVYGKYPKCYPIRLSSEPDEVPKTEKKTVRNTNCTDRECFHITQYGSSKCNKMVELYRPFKHVAVECRFPQNVCAQCGKHSINKYECQTIWCVGEMLTIYKENGKLYQGYLTIKKPCKCDCRKKKNRST
uniref:uncharacterized protein LOC120330135 n=1 Tax=Styela clava TaxID=7725 RepID=UPI00193951D0|nr:uncharacterized protein LOC120330135 [Styela clava]XP_039252913.1 uncharacterized protein LOC120330135 [Styela clava]